MLGARYVKSFNTLTSSFQGQAASRSGDERAVQWICGDDAEAKMTVMVFDDIKNKHRMAVREVNGGMIAEKDGGLLTFVDTSQAGPLDVDTDENSTTLLGRLPAGSRVRCVGYIPAWKMSPPQSDSWLNATG